MLLYVVAFAGAAVIALLLWRAMNGDRAEIPRGTGSPRTGVPPHRARPTGPDDDPDFLRSLDESLHKDGEDPPAPEK